MRLFAGIFPPATLLERLEEIARAVRLLHPNAILVKPEKMHLTVRFFGRADLEETTQVLEAAMNGATRFEVTLDHIDAFPNRRMAHVVFCGVREPKQLEALMFAVGQRKPRAHLTLARLASPRTVKKLGIEPLSFWAERICLVNSVLGEEARYEVLREWSLG